MTSARLQAVFAKAAAENRAAFVAYLMAGDPDIATSETCFDALIEAGADVIEIGAPFTDPMADGPAIQAAGLRALAAKTTLKDVIALAARLRAKHPDVGLILMGYANPVHRMGYRAFADAAAEAGLDGAIVVDLPPEEDAPLRAAFAGHGLSMIRMATPTTTEARMKTVADGASGFVYYVSVAGVTGAGVGAETDIAAGVERARRVSGLPVAVGFGVRRPDQAAAFARIADGVVVGSALVEEVRAAHEANAPQTAASRIAALAGSLSEAIAVARKGL